MSFSHQCTGALPDNLGDADLQHHFAGFVGGIEQEHPSQSYTLRVLRGDVAHTEHSALYAAASFAVRLNYSEYKTHRLYVALAAPTLVSRKRKAGASHSSIPWVYALVGYDYFV